jgi:exosortase/archaeosortase family protein
LNSEFSFIILTYNEEIHLPRLLESIEALNAGIFILDSGSTDKTIEIANSFGATILTHAFENHPKQWDYALKNFDIKTPWIICLDADQIVTHELSELLKNFRAEDFKHADGIYFNRKNYFKGKWIKHGSYYPLYLLKMIRFGAGFSDLNENMDHRFIVPGKTIVWKNGHILEENLKENNISFWIEKHNRYSTLVAIEEVERMNLLRTQTIKPQLFGSPDERTAWLKQIWWKLPRYVRPMIYFFNRMTFQLGILDGTTGIIFHFLQGFWFRLIVDIKIDELLNQQKATQPTNYSNKNESLKFVFLFIVLFAFFYYFNIYFFSLTSEASAHRNSILVEHFDYIRGLRLLLLHLSTQVLNWLGYSAITDEYNLLVAGRGKIQLVYSCLGLGVMSFFSAFVLSYPKKWKQKIMFLVAGLFAIQFLNVIRFVVLALFWHPSNNKIIDHHTIFNLFIYTVIAVSLYFWVKQDDSLTQENATN